MSSTTNRIKIEKCREWAANPTVNPLTGKTIMVNGPKYNELKEVCLRKYNITPQQVAEEGEPAAEEPAQEEGEAVAPVPVPSRSNSSSRSPTYQQAVLRRRTAKNASLTANEKWLSKRCTNEDQDMITLEELGENDISNIFVIYMKNRDGSKWIKKNYCNKRDVFYKLLENDKNIFKQMTIGLWQIPDNILANWIRTNENIPVNSDGTAGQAGNKIFIKVPGINFLITLKSYLRIQNNVDNKEWYALPLFEKNKILIGNILNITTVASITHGQRDSLIYKLFTREEIDKLPNENITEDDDEYDSLIVKRNRELWNKPLPNDERELNEYNRKTIKSILLTKPIISDEHECKYMTQNRWIYIGQEKPGYEYWIDPFNNINNPYNEQENIIYYSRYNRNFANVNINKDIYNNIYRHVYSYLYTFTANIERFDIFIKIIDFIIYYLTHTSQFNIYRSYITNNEISNQVIFIIAAIRAVNSKNVTRLICEHNLFQILKAFQIDVGDDESEDMVEIVRTQVIRHPYINALNTKYTELKNFITISKFNDYNTVYDLILNCNFITTKNLIEINKDNKLENTLRYVYQNHIFLNYAPIYLARRIVKSILLGKSDRIFKKILPKLDPGYEGLIGTSHKPEPPIISYDRARGRRCIEIPFW